MWNNSELYMLGWNLKDKIRPKILVSLKITMLYTQGVHVSCFERFLNSRTACAQTRIWSIYPERWEFTWRVRSLCAQCAVSWCICTCTQIHLQSNKIFFQKLFGTSTHPFIICMDLVGNLYLKYPSKLPFSY